ncbi:MAG: hypothetical protein V8T00_01730 [Oscillospiraceae bacterium]
MRIYAPILTLVTLGLSVLSMLQAEDSFLWAWTALMIASFPVGIFLSFSRPFAAQARRLSRAGAAIGGWFGPECSAANAASRSKTQICSRRRTSRSTA